MASLPAAVARCALHPDLAAGGTCPRCGTFFCESCAQGVLGVLYCAPCAARPEVNYLEALRLKLWGRRDGNAWGALFWCALFLLLALYGASERSWLPALVSLGGAGVCTGLFLGQPWSRPALLALPVALGGLAGLYGGPLPGFLALLFGFPYAAYSFWMRSSTVPPRASPAWWARSKPLRACIQHPTSSRGEAGPKSGW